MKIKIDKATTKRIIKALTPIIIDILFRFGTKGKGNK